MRVRINDLQAGTQYYLQFRANDGDSVSEWSQRFDVVTTSKADFPATPQNVTWIRKGRSFLGTWDAVTTNFDGSPIKDFSHYNIQLIADSGSVVYRTQAERFDLTFEQNVAAWGEPQAVVGFRVASVDTARNQSDWSDVITASNPPPSRPTGLTSRVNQNIVTLRWNENPENDIDKYRIYQGTDRLWSGAALSKNIVLGYGITTTLSLVAVDVFNTESPRANEIVTTPGAGGGDTTPPDTPTGLQATLITDPVTFFVSAQLSWNPVSAADLDSYIIRYRKEGDSIWTQVAIFGDQTSTIITGLELYTNYEFQIASVDFGSNRSPWSAIVTAEGDIDLPPSQPAAPTVAANTMQIQVSHNNLKALGGPMEPDVRYYEVYASNVNNFTPSSANRLGTMDAGPAISGVWPVPAGSSTGSAEVWYAKVIAVDAGGQKSPASAQNSGTVPLISDANIANATITDAKITNLSANKLISGSGIITDLLIGNTTQRGSLRSYTYIAGSQGWAVDSNGSVEFNNGTFRGSLYTGPDIGPQIRINSATANDPRINFVDRVGTTAVNLNSYILGRTTVINQSTDDSSNGAGSYSGTDVSPTGALPDSNFNSNRVEINSGRVTSGDRVSKLEILSGTSDTAQSRITFTTDVVRFVAVGQPNKATLAIINNTDVNIGSDPFPGIRIGMDNTGRRMRLYHDGIAVIGSNGLQDPMRILTTDLQIYTGPGGTGAIKINGERIVSRNIADTANLSLLLQGSVVDIKPNSGLFRFAGGVNTIGRILVPNGDCSLVFDGDTLRVAAPAYDEINANATNANHRNIRASGFLAPSSEEENKRNITLVDGQEAIEIVKSLPVYDFSYKNEDGTEPSMRSVMADDADVTFPMMVGGSAPDRSVDIMRYTFTLGAAMRGIIEKLEELDQRVAALES